MKHDEIMAALKRQAEEGDGNARVLLAFYGRTTHEERKAQRQRAVDRLRGAA